MLDRMKFTYLLFLSILILNTGTVFAQEQAPPADDILNSAFETAMHEDKNVFVMFTASWCGWCKKMDASMTDESTRAFFNDNYVTVHLVIKEAKDKKHLENPGAEALFNENGGAGGGIPYWLIYDPEGELLADSRTLPEKDILKGEGSNIGCPAMDREISAFLYKLSKTSDLNDAELKIIENRFRLNNPYNQD
jgi:thioredoxin-related protein